MSKLAKNDNQIFIKKHMEALMPKSGYTDTKRDIITC